MSREGPKRAGSVGQRGWARPSSTGTQGQAPAPPPIHDHELLCRLGSGSYGEVWLAKNVLGLPRAVKIVHRQSFEERDAFDREFNGLQKVEPISRAHEGLVDILQVGRTEEYLYYVMELADPARLPGESGDRSPGPGEGATNADYSPHTLRSDLTKRGRLPAEDCIDLGLKLTSALAHFHQHGLVHRDVKPSNIIFVGCQPKLADIGLVAETSEARSFVGTLGFIPPEGPGTPQADLYGLGKTLYEAATGRSRQEFPNLPGNLRELEDYELLTELNEVILKACDDDPKLRYASAEQMHQHLTRVREGRTVRRIRWLEKRLAFAKKAVLLIAGLSVVGASLLFQARRGEKAALAQLSRRHVLNGAQSMDQGEWFDALVDFTEALRLDGGKSDRAVAHRVRISSLLQHCPLPTGLFLPQQGRMLDAGFCLDGNRIWTVDTRAIRVFNATNGELLHCLKNGHELIRAYASPHGRRIVAVTSDGLGHVWDVANGRPTILPFPHPVYRTILGSYTVAMWKGPNEIRLMKWTDPLWREPLQLPEQEIRLRLGFTGANSNVIIEVTLEDPNTGTKLFPTKVYTDTPVMDPQEFDAERREQPHLDEDGVVGLQLYADPFPDATVDHQLVFSDFEVRQFDLSGKAISELKIPVVEGDPVPGWSISDWANDQTSFVGSKECFTLTAPNLGRPYAAMAWWQSNRFRIVEGQKLEFSVRLINAVQAWPILSLTFYAVGELDFGFLGRELNRCYDTSPDGKTIATLTDSTRRTVVLRHLATGALTCRPLAHDGEVRQVRFNPTGESVATVSGRMVFLWDALTGERLPTSYENDERITDLCFSPDGTLLAAASDGNIVLWDPHTKLERQIPTRQTRSPFVAFSADGSRIVTAGPNNTVRIWDAVTGDHLLTIPLDQMPYQAGFSPDGRLLVTLGERNSARVWDAETGEAITPPLPHHILAGLPEFHPAGHLLMTIDQHLGARVWDLSKRTPARLALPPARGLLAGAVSPDGKVRARMGERGQITLRTSNPQSRTLTIDQRDSLKRMLFDTNGKYLVAERQDTKARWWEIRTGEPLTPWLKTLYDVENLQPSLSAVTPYAFWPDADLMRVAQLLASQRLDSQEGRRPLAAAEVRGLWSTLTNRHAATFGVSQDQIAWHEREARRSEQSWNWWGALFHLDRLVALDPTNHQFRTRRGYADLALSKVRQRGASYEQTRHVIPPRPPQADSTLIDLTPFYTQTIKEDLSGSGGEDTLESLPTGVTKLAGVNFDVRGLVRLTSTHSIVPGIPVHRHCAALSFLHATDRWNPLYTQVGRFIVHYADGSTNEIALKHGVDTAYYNAPLARPLNLEPSEGGLDSTLAWAGTNPTVQAHYRPLRLFRSTWTNPAPENEVVRIEFLSDTDQGALFLLAITAD